MFAGLLVLFLAGLPGTGEASAIDASSSLVLLQSRVRPIPKVDASTMQSAPADVQVDLKQMALAALEVPDRTSPVALASTTKTSPVALAYTVSMFTVATCIIIIYWHRGMAVITKILIYLFAVSTMTLSVKWVFAMGGFEYPAFLTATHMFISSVVGFSILLKRKFIDGASIVVPTAREFFCQIGLLSSSIAISLAANNHALLFCSASFVEIIAATTPIVAAGMIVIKGMPFHMALLGPACLVAVGCSLSVVGEVHFSLLGFVLCFVSNASRALKVVIQQDLMTGATKEKFDPCALMAWMCFTSFLIMIVWSSASEGLAPYIFFADSSKRLQTIPALLVSCINAVTLNLAALFVTKELGAVGGQLVAQTKSVLTVLGSIAVFHDSFSAKEVIGFATVLSGAYLYSSTEKRLKDGQAAGKA